MLKGEHGLSEEPHKEVHTPPPTVACVRCTVNKIHGSDILYSRYTGPLYYNLNTWVRYSTLNIYAIKIHGSAILLSRYMGPLYYDQGTWVRYGSAIL